MKPTDLYEAPNVLATHYRHFRVDERLLLTGHSHQAWPDCGLDGHTLAWLDAAECADQKWDRAFAKAERVRSGFQTLLDEGRGPVALGSNTHELVVRFLSALPLRQRPRLVTTDGEFHTIRRQLDRLREEGIEVVKISAERPDEIATRVSDATNDRTAAVLVSSVLYQTAAIVPGLDRVLQTCQQVGAQLLVDAYHALNVIPIALQNDGLEGAFVVGGGYKYCQLGEGNCFLRFPVDCTMRPVITGWFSEFDSLIEPADDVVYGPGPSRFAGATYDPTSHYRAAAVFDFFVQHGITPTLLRAVSQHQLSVLISCFDDLDLDASTISRDTAVPLQRMGGFLPLRTSRAAEITAGLGERDVRVDYRENVLRFGPAPYLHDGQLRDAMMALGEVVRALGPN